MTHEDEEFDWKNVGPCCSCGRDNLEVRNVVMIEQKNPGGKDGWGCLQCHLPMEGAVALICDECAELGRPIKFAVDGEIKNKKRIPVESLGAEHKHDMSQHPEVNQ